MAEQPSRSRTSVAKAVLGGARVRLIDSYLQHSRSGDVTDPTFADRVVQATIEYVGGVGRGCRINVALTTTRAPQCVWQAQHLGQQRGIHMGYLRAIHPTIERAMIAGVLLLWLLACSI